MVTATVQRPQKPTPDFPLWPHPRGKWAKKVDGKFYYFGRWDDPAGALAEYEAWLAGSQPSKRTPRNGSGAKAPAVPRDFPLKPHGNGQWYKHIRGRNHYFGPLADWQGARERYDAQRSDLEAGRKPSPESGDLKLKDLCNLFLNTKRVLVEQGRRQSCTYEDCLLPVRRLKQFFGGDQLVAELRPEDFNRLLQSMPQDWSVVTRDNFIGHVREIFNFASKEENGPLLAKKVPFGQVFKKAERKEHQKHRDSQPMKFLDREVVLEILELASPTLRAMILLGVNCGFGNKDVGTLTFGVYCANSEWIEYPRSKTGICRKCHLWPETREALAAAVAERPTPKDDYKDFVFITKYGTCWYKDDDDKSISNAFAKLKKKSKLLKGRNTRGLGFYCLRHDFQTIGDETFDFPAVKQIMGHTAGAGDMSAVYRAMISDERLKRVTDYVHDWLYNVENTSGTEKSVA